SLAVLVAFCVFAVVGNTIRLAVASRSGEIEVMKLCGATDGVVRRPFVIEGTLQGLFAGVLSIVLLFISFSLFRSELNATLAAILGVRTYFLDVWATLAIILGGGLL